MTFNAAAAYQGTKVNTASPAELTLMLYEGAIKFCNKAIHAMENDDIQNRNTNFLKAQKIITQLRISLDFKYPVANDFDLVYEYIYRRLIEANVKADIEIAQESLRYIREMRDTWKEVMKKNKLYVQ